MQQLPWNICIGHKYKDAQLYTKKIHTLSGWIKYFPQFLFLPLSSSPFCCRMPIQLWRQRSWFRPRWEEEEPPIINCNSFWREKIEISASASEMMMMIRKMICSRHLAGSLQRREDHDANCAESCNHFAHKLPQGCKKSTMLQNFAKKYAAGQKWIQWTQNESADSQSSASNSWAHCTQCTGQHTTLGLTDFYYWLL